LPKAITPPPAAAFTPPPAAKVAAKKIKKSPGQTALEATQREIKAVDNEISRRAAGVAPTTLQEINRLTPGQVVKTGIRIPHVDDLDSPVPHAKPKPSEWAQGTAEKATVFGRVAKMLFDNKSGGHLSEADQAFAKRRWELAGNLRPALEQITKLQPHLAAVVKALTSSFREDIVAQLQKEMPDLLKQVDAVDAHVKGVIERLIRHTAETSHDAAGASRALKFFGLDDTKVAADALNDLSNVGEQMKSAQKAIKALYDKTGGRGGNITDIIDASDIMDEELMAALNNGLLPDINYLSREGAAHPDSLMRAMERLSRPRSSLARHEALRSVPSEVVERIGKLVQEGKRSKLKEADIVTSVMDKYGKEWLGRELKEELDEAGAKTGEKVPKWTPEEHALKLVEWGKDADNYATYTNNLLRVHARYAMDFFTNTTNNVAIHDLAFESLERRSMQIDMQPLFGYGVMGAGKGGMGFRAKDVHMRGRVDWRTEFGDKPGNLMGMYKAAGMDPDRSIAYLAEKIGITDPEDLKYLMDHGSVPIKVVETIVGSRNVWKLTGVAKVMADIIDIPTKWFKENVTLPFLSFATRNHVSGQFIIMASGVLENLDDYMEYGRQYYKAFKDFRSGKIPPELNEELFLNGVLHENMMFEGVQARGGEFGKVIPDPISVRAGWQNAKAQIEPSFLDKIPGLRAARTAQGTVLEVGGQVNKFVEYMNRVPLYVTLKKKGWSEADAARKVAEIQIDYTKHNFSPFEQEVMKRLVPFYSFQRKIAPVVLGSLARNPGGPMGLAIRGSRLASSTDPTVPEWLSGTLAVENPLGSNEEGGKSYITGFGMPYEPTLSFLGGGVRGAGREALSQLNPLIKAPLEWATGQSFFQTGPNGTGRPLDELNPPIGQTLSNIAGFDKPVDLPDGLEFAAANSPFSRYLSTARQITDRRKHPLSLAANLLTGVRVTDVSPGAQDAILRDRANAVVKQLGGRTFSQTYIPDQANLNPAEQGLANQLAELKRLLDKRHRARKQELSMAP
jgi:hypothetical protein